MNVNSDETSLSGGRVRVCVPKQPFLFFRALTTLASTNTSPFPTALLSHLDVDPRYPPVVRQKGDTHSWLLLLGPKLVAEVSSLTGKLDRVTESAEPSAPADRRVRAIFR